MKKTTLLLLLVLTGLIAQAQSRFSTHELSINAFRNPSIGAEYRYKFVSLHAGFYPTNFVSNTTTQFIRTGVSLWFLPVGKWQNPSSFYSSVSLARGLSRDYEGKNAVMGEVGFRWMIVKGVNFRLGVTALSAKGESLKINPTPGLSYSFFWK